MCGRYTLIKLADFIDVFPWIHLPDEIPPGSSPPRYNIAPSQNIAVVPNDGTDKLQFFHWGLIPSWAKETAIGNRMINARAETLSSKPAFRNALKRRRCIIPASGFYEWKKSPDGKSRQPMYVRMRSGKPFAFAGLWEVWRDDAGNELPSCTIITTEPNELMKEIHNRMPAILRPENFKRWLDRSEKSPDEILPLIQPYPAAEMEALPVSKKVNSPTYDSADCIEPAKADDPTPPGLFD